MKIYISLILFTLVQLIVSCSKPEPQIGEMVFPEGKVQHVIHAKEIQWQPCPPHLPSGCEMAVLEGNPKSNGLFTVRFKVAGNFLMPPHTHPKEERVTILEGKAYVAFGENGKREDAKTFSAGDYYVNARNAIHTVWADSATVLQITGIGPWEVDFIH